MIPPVSVERADSRPVQVVPLRQTREWAVRVGVGFVGFLTGGWFVFGLVVLYG